MRKHMHKPMNTWDTRSYVCSQEAYGFSHLKEVCGEPTRTGLTAKAGRGTPTFCEQAPLPLAPQQGYQEQDLLRK